MQDSLGPDLHATPSRVAGSAPSTSLSGIFCEKIPEQLSMFSATYTGQNEASLVVFCIP